MISEQIATRLLLLKHCGTLSLPVDLAPNPKESDIYLASFPKSGNTWFRYLLAYAIWPELENLDLVEMAKYVPSVNLKNDIRRMLDEEAPCNKLGNRIIKNHAPYAPNIVTKKSIYIVRDGRDAITSYWHFCNQRDGTDIPLGDFIASPQSHPYGAWGDHVASWLNAPIAVLMIKYEDLLADTAGCVRQALDFCGIERDATIIEKAVEKSSFNSLRKIEAEKGLNLDHLSKVKFFRKGKIGSWQEEFGEGDLETFNQYHGGPIPELGYKW